MEPLPTATVRARAGTLLVPLLVATILALVVGGVAALQQRGVGLYIVASGSMEPAIATGSIVLTQPAPGYDVGDVITFRAGGGIVTHRVVEVASGGALSTQGDANAAVDPGRVAPGAVMGRVTVGVPVVGYALVFLQQPTTVPALILLAVAAALVGASRRPTTQPDEGMACARPAV